MNMEDHYPRLPLSVFFQPILIRTAYNTVQVFEGFPVSSYSLVRWGKTFQVLEVEAFETAMLSSDGIKREKGEEDKANRKSLPTVETVQRRW